MMNLPQTNGLSWDATEQYYKVASNLTVIISNSQTMPRDHTNGLKVLLVFASEAIGTLTVMVEEIKQQAEPLLHTCLDNLAYSGPIPIRKNQVTLFFKAFETLGISVIHPSMRYDPSAPTVAIAADDVESCEPTKER